MFHISFTIFSLEFDIEDGSSDAQATPQLMDFIDIDGATEIRSNALHRVERAYKIDSRPIQQRIISTEYRRMEKCELPEGM